jgi:hypothetical protein
MKKNPGDRDISMNEYVKAGTDLGRGCFLKGVNCTFESSI